MTSSKRDNARVPAYQLNADLYLASTLFIFRIFPFDFCFFFWQVKFIIMFFELMQYYIYSQHITGDAFLWGGLLYFTPVTRPRGSYNIFDSWLRNYLAAMI